MKTAMTAFVLSTALLAACGNDDESASRKSQAPQMAPAGVVDRDPYAITCGHVRDQLEWADVTRRATVAIADGEPFRNLNRLQATQSLFYAMTELCKGSPASREPAAAAVEAVRQGRYRVDLGTP